MPEFANSKSCMTQRRRLIEGGRLLTTLLRSVRHILGRERKVCLGSFDEHCMVCGAQCALIMLQVGICHSDYHHVMNEWGRTKYPVVPGCDLHVLNLAFSLPMH